MEEATDRGISFVHQSGFREIPLLPEINGSGIAIADFNSDGWLDIYFVQSGSLYRDEAALYSNELYFNVGEGQFEKSGQMNGAGDGGYGMGVAVGDYDNDGDADLFVTNVGPNVLLENDGQGNFHDVSTHAGIDDPSFGTSATFQDFDRDGDLDLFVANYVNWNLGNEVECYEGGVRSYCPPERYNAPAANRIYRNDGDGTFTDVSQSAGIASSFGHSFGVVSSDFNLDGLVDVYVANDRTPNELWINQGDFRFIDAANEYGVSADGYGMVKAGMGTESADFDDDGDFDLLVVNLVGETDTLFRNESVQFTDVTARMGLNSVTSRFTRWGVAWEDFDNDRDLDLYIANGGVYPVDLGQDDIYAELNVLLEGRSHSHYTQARISGETKKLLHTSRGVAVGDLDRDGGLDLIVQNRDGPPYLLMNRVASDGNWTSFDVQVQAGLIAHGARLTLRVGDQQRSFIVTRDGSFLSSNDPRVHVGLGAEKQVRDISVRWLNGQLETFGTLEGNQHVVLRQGTGNPLYDTENLGPVIE